MNRSASSSGFSTDSSVTRVLRRLATAILVAGLPGLCGGVRPLVGQDAPPLRLEVTLTPDTASQGAGLPQIRLRNLLEDSRWAEALRSGLPIRLHYRVELWRSRSGWLDAFERQTEWDVLVRREPLLDQYTMVTALGRARRVRRYGTLDALSAALEFSYRVAVRPAEPGTYYYIGSLRISTLSDSDLAELDRFLRGGNGGDGGLGAILGRGATRILLRFAGLPTQRIEARSPEFTR